MSDVFEPNADWKTVNAKLKNLPETLLKIAEEAKNKPKEDWLGTELKNATDPAVWKKSALNLLNSMTFGASDTAIKAVSPEAYNEMQAERSTMNPVTRVVADIGGGIVNPLSKAGAISKLGGNLLTGAGKALGGEAIEQLGKKTILNKLGSGLLGAGEKLTSTGVNLAKPSTSILQAVGKGAGAGLEQVVPWIATDAIRGEFDPIKSLMQAGLSTGLGGAMGGGFKGASNIIKPKKVPEGSINPEDFTQTTLKDVVGEGVDKATENTFKLFGVDKMAMRRFRNKWLGNGSDANKLGRWQKERDELIEFGEKMKLGNSVNRDGRLNDLYKNVSEKYKELDDLVQKSGFNVKDELLKLSKGDASNLADDTVEALSNVKRTYPDQADQAILNIMDDMTKASDIVGMRKRIANIINSASKGNTAQDAINYDVGQAIRGLLEDGINDIAQKSGNPGLKDLGRVWKGLQFYAGPALRDEMGVATGGNGSMTFEKFKLDEMLTGKAPVDLSKGPIGALGQMVGKGVGALKNYASSIAREPLKKLQDVLPESMPKVNQAIENAIPKASGVINAGVRGSLDVAGEEQIDDSVNPLASPVSVESPVDSVKQAPTESKRKKYQDKIEQKIGRIYQELEAKFPGSYSYDDIYNGFQQATNGFDPVKSANLIFTDPEERKNFKQQFVNVSKLSKLSGKALSDDPEYWISNLLNSNRTSKKEAEDFRDTLTLVVSGPGKVPSKAEQEYVKEVMSKLRSATPEKRNEILKETLAQFGVNIDTYKDLGVI